MKERYEIRRADNNLCFYTRTNRKDAQDIKEQVERVTKVAHYIWDTKRKEEIS